MAPKNPLGLLPSRQSARKKSKNMEGNEAAGVTEPAFPLEENGKPAERIGSAMLILRSNPTTEEWNRMVASAKHGIVLTGTVAERPIGPIIGLVDIGTCNDAYLFRMSLPGVSRAEGDFSCEIESNGRVLVRGITLTGEKRVCKHSQIFEMHTQNLCPPGHFTISFQLPGPVEHRGFAATLGNDGIFEGIVLKRDPEDHIKVQTEEKRSTPAE